MKSSTIFIIICPFFVFSKGEPLKNPVRLSSLKSELDELQECYSHHKSDFGPYAATVSKIKIEVNEHYSDVTGGTIDLTNLHKPKTIEGTPLRYKTNKFYINKNYNKELKDFENYKVTHFNPSATTTKSGTNPIIYYYSAEEFDQSVKAAISKINMDPRKVLDLNIYKIDPILPVPQARHVSAYYNKDTDMVTITSSFKVLLSDHIPLPGKTLPDPVVKHGLMYDIKSKSFKDGYGLRTSEILTPVPVFKLRPYPYCDERQQEESKFWERDRSLEINNFLLKYVAVDSITAGGSSLMKFDKNIQLTLKCNRMTTSCNLHGSFTIDGDDVQEIVSDKYKQFFYKSSTRHQKSLLQCDQVLLHPLNRKEVDKISNMKPEKIFEYVRIPELKTIMRRTSNYLETTCRSLQPAFPLHYILNYRKINMEYKCEGKYFEIVKEPSLYVALYKDNTLYDTLNSNDLESNITYSPQSDVFATRTIVNGIYGFAVEDHIEFRAKDVASDLGEMAHYFDEIKSSSVLSKHAKYPSTSIVMRIGTNEMFIAKLNSPETFYKTVAPALPSEMPSGAEPVMRVEGNFANFVKENESKEVGKGEDKPFETFFHDGKGFLLTDKRGNLRVDPVRYNKSVGSIRIRLVKKPLLQTRQEGKIKKEIFYAKVSDLHEILKYIKLQTDSKYCQNYPIGIYNVYIHMRENTDFIVVAIYSCPSEYFSIEIKPNTKIFTKDGKGVILTQLARVVFLFDLVSITIIRNDDFKDIYAFRVKGYSEERGQRPYHPGDKTDICTDRINGFKYSCFVSLNTALSGGIGNGLIR